MRFSIFVYKTRKPQDFRSEASFKIWHRPTLPHVTAVPSALAGLTSLFGMGRGGHRRYRHLNIFKVESLKFKVQSSSLSTLHF